MEKIAKTKTRKDMLAKRRALSESVVSAVSKDICEAVRKLNVYESASDICLYAPVNNEVDVMLLVDTADGEGRRFWLPKVDGSEMRFHRYMRGDVLVKGRYDIPEPVSAEVLTPDKRTLVIMPGVAFSEKGDRIGYGGGYYDRYIAENAVCMTVGVCYDFQILPYVTSEAHDMRPQFVISEKRIVN